VRSVLPLLIARGQAVTSQELADAAGVSEGTIFNVFGSKDDLLAAALDSALEQEPFERAVEAIDHNQPFVDQLTAATELIQHRIVDVWRLISGIGSSHQRHERPLPPSPALTAVLMRHHDRITADPAEAARLLRALTLSLTHPLLTAQAVGADRIVEVFLNGVGRHERTTGP